MDAEFFGNVGEVDRGVVWHPFTPMGRWMEEDPLVLVRGEGCYVFDERGRRYLDGNSSIWTNVHGHGHPKINAAILDQLGRVAHTSFLGTTNGPAVRLAERLVGLAPKGLTRVFYSDDGSTAVEVAMRMSLQFFEQNGEGKRKGLVAFERAYHGDTLGAASGGGIPLFRGAAGEFGYPVTRVETADDLERVPREVSDEVAALVIEPLIQGAAGMRVWPVGMLKSVEKWCRERGVFLILDEVMTGFGRTGTMFACEQEEVSPDFLCLAKGLTGGYLPLAATLTTDRVFEGFLDRGDGVDRTFYYGHSYCGSALGSAAANASLDVFEEERVLEGLVGKMEVLGGMLEGLRGWDRVREVRRCGFVGAVEVEGVTGAEVCRRLRELGVLTRPIRDVVVVMLPLCAGEAEIMEFGEALGKALRAGDGRGKALCAGDGR